MSIVWAPLLFFAVLPGAWAQAITVQASATIIAPISVMNSLADLPVTASVSGGWVRLALVPVAAPLTLVSRLSPLRDAAVPLVRVTSKGGSTLLRTASVVELRGEFATSLSSPAPLNGGGYRVAVAFN